MSKKKAKKLKICVDSNNNIAVKEFKYDENLSLKKLIDKYGDKVYNLAYSITRDHAESEEVFQDVFLIVFNKIHSLRNARALSSWINTITANVAKMKVRERSKTSLLLDSVNSVAEVELVSNCQNTSSSNGMHCLLTTEAKNVVQEAISDLPPKYKSVIILNDLNNFSIRKTSDILNISIPAVKSRLRRARQKLKHKLDLYFLENIN
jgi:RNA polymerase sigma-70 factor (ECF subfamily)